MTCALPSSGTARITSKAANDRHGNATVHLRASRDIETSRDRQGELGARPSANRLAYQSKETRGAVARGTGYTALSPGKLLRGYAGRRSRSRCAGLADPLLNRPFGGRPAYA